jgi:hypothetical protein
MIDLNQHSHSKDELKLINQNGMSYVQKIFKENPQRSRENVEKQIAFSPINSGSVNVCAAEVTSFEHSSDGAVLTMPYIHGLSGNDFPIHATREIASTISSGLSAILYAQLANTREEAVPTKLFVDKIEQVIANIHDPDLKALAVSAKEKIAALPDQLIFPLGRCHGDLTLSNIILSPTRGLTLIDFLSTYLETPLQDVAKLKQDYVYGWTFRKSAPAVVVKYEILKKNFTPVAIAQIERLYPVQTKLLTLMTLLRIAPYVTDLLTKQWLETSVGKCLSEYDA